MRLLNWIFIVIIWSLASCDKGISPVDKEEKAGFGGTVTFSGKWPVGITATHLVLFKDPLLSKDDFNVDNLKFISTEIPYGVESYEFNSIDDLYLGLIEPGEYSYLGVAQTRSLIISLEREAWFVIGVYYNGADNSQPGNLIIPGNTFVSDINISCDFNNPPEQPPGG